MIMQETFLVIIEDDTMRTADAVEETLKETFSAGAPWFDEA